MRSQPSVIRGYTLMEMIVVLGMVAILAAIATPSFSKQVKQARLTSNANQLHSVFKFARSEAAKREKQVKLVAIAADSQWTVKVGSEVLSVFKPTHQSISVDTLADLDISVTGSTASTSFTISDGDSSTDDYLLCIYISGQSQLSKGGACS